MKYTELYTDAGIARIYPRCNEWGWTLNGSEGIERTFGAAIEAAEEEGILQAQIAEGDWDEAAAIHSKQTNNQ